MVPAQHRLKDDRDFKRLSKRGRSFFSESLSVRVAKNNAQISRFAFVVSTKTAKKTVDRNKVKRRLREIIRLNIHKINAGYDILIAVKRPALTMTYEDLQAATFTVLKKAKLLQ